MHQTWRWFGPDDRVSLRDIRQAGAAGVVTALYHVPPGRVWTPEAIRQRQDDVRRDSSGVETGLEWDVVESLPVSEDIKTADRQRDAHIVAWTESMRNLAAAVLDVICYNFMPILDWTRTDLAAPVSSGARALRFELNDFAVFDIHILGRGGAVGDYPQDVGIETARRAEGLKAEDRDRLVANVLAGLPGAAENWTLDSLKEQLQAYDQIDAEALRANLQYFLERVVPEAEGLGLRLCCHPDDPPWSLLGLPQIMSTENDYRWLVEAVPSPANGITFCTGSLGARGDNDLPGMMERLGSHVHFLHLRNVRREDDRVPGSFHEDEHLSGSTDMIAVLRNIVAEETRRHMQGRDDCIIPMRPDHGQQILDDYKRRSAPGYPTVGRLKGLAELRGVSMSLERVARGRI